MTELGDLLPGFAAALVRVAMPLLLAGLGEMLAERSGVINLGIEGSMLAGALAAAIGASSGGPWAGAVAAVGAGAALAGLFALVTVHARADQIIAGTAVTLGAMGLTGAAYRAWFGPAGAGLSIPTFPPVILGQPATTFVALALVPLLWWLLFRTRAGLALRAAGEGADGARAAGVRVRAARTAAVVAGGALAGLAGATLVLAQVGTFTERMTAGRGFIAIAIVVLGRWNPVGVLLAALVFGAATALQFLFQAAGTDVPYQLFLMLPYLLALLGLAGAVGRVRAPRDLGRSEIA
ncbi:MAG TPA: ABC transporter permease [Gemmatimonadales bacterium]